MASIDDIIREIESLRLDIIRLINDIRVNAAQVIIGDLSQLSGDLGLVKAGEFRSGVGEPGRAGSPFTGVRYGYPGFVYGGFVYNIVGLDNDTMQFGIRATDGYAVFGGGAGWFNADGLGIRTGSGDANVIRWYDSGDFPRAGWFCTSDASVAAGEANDGWLWRREMIATYNEHKEMSEWVLWIDTAQNASQNLFEYYTHRLVAGGDTSSRDALYEELQYYGRSDTVGTWDIYTMYRVRPYAYQINPDHRDMYMSLGEMDTPLAASDGLAGQGILFTDSGNLFFVSNDGVLYQLNTT